MDPLILNCSSVWLFAAFSIPSYWRAFSALQYEGVNLSYEALALSIEKMAEHLQKEGILKGDRVAFLGTASTSTVIVFFALLKLEASPCLLSTRTPKEMLPVLMQRARIAFFLEQENLALTRISWQKSEKRLILLFTSGSSGVPKLACLTFEQFLLSALSSAPFLQLVQEKSRWLLSVPLFHVSGLSILFRSLATGSSILIAPMTHPIASLSTHLSLVPTQLIRLLEMNIEQQFPHLTCLLLGGAPISEDLFKKGLKRNLPIKVTYGMTETASQITMTETLDEAKAMHLGKVLPGKQISFTSEGEILVKGNSLFLGYDQGEEPILPTVGDGWFATGDLGSLSTEGNLIYKGRKDNLFISGGENIYPEEIEKALGTIPGVTLSFVLPIEDPEYGMRPIAFVQMDTPLPSKEEFQEKLLSKIPKFSLPLHFYPFPKELDKDFKIKRADLKKWVLS